MKQLFFVLFVSVIASVANATTVAGDTCGEPDRVATLDGALQCSYGLANPDATDIAGYYGDVWDAAGELTGNGTNGYLKATSDGGWGNIPNSGTWAIDADFWNIYDSAVISMHIGQGGGDPDHWAWLIDPNVSGGNWSLDYVLNGQTGGGGLSNIKLWGVTSSAKVPAPATLALLGLGLVGLVATRRRKA